MGLSGIASGIFMTVIGGIFVTWLFAPTDANARALHRLKIMGSILYRLLGVLGAGAMVINSGYDFYKFAYSTAPIARLEIIGLFVSVLNFFVYLVVGMAVIAIWLRGDGSPSRNGSRSSSRTYRR